MQCFICVRQPPFIACFIVCNDINASLDATSCSVFCLLHSINYTLIKHNNLCFDAILNNVHLFNGRLLGILFGGYNSLQLLMQLRDQFVFFLIMSFEW